MRILGTLGDDTTVERIEIEQERYDGAWEALEGRTPDGFRLLLIRVVD